MKATSAQNFLLKPELDNIQQALEIIVLFMRSVDTILLKCMWYGVVPNNAFLPVERLEIGRTKLHTIIGSQNFQLPLSLLLNHDLPSLERLKCI
jgi:hypothetical protein